MSFIRRLSRKVAAPWTQSPNSKGPWTQSQRDKGDVFDDVRWIEINKDEQPNPLSARKLVEEKGITMVMGNKVSCFGSNDGRLGHPAIFINLDNKERYHSCGYCGRKYQGRD